MASTASRHANWKTAATLGGLVISLAAPAPAMAQEPGSSRVRAGDATAAALLRGGLARSATLRAIVETIERSDLIVYIEARPIRLPGQLQLVAATPGCRHLRVSVRVPGMDTEMVAWLGHELWHAAELSGAPDVRDQAGLLRFYKQIGHGGSSDSTVESSKAQEVWTTVLYEARASGRPQ